MNCYTLLPVWPPMVTITGISTSILVANVESHREPLEVTFSDLHEDEALRFLGGAQGAMCVLGVIYDDYDCGLRGKWNMSHL